ncbi:DUF4258 domain-containing protein [Sinomicrobium weinanense]|uniref:DUF4258 domain-containing protein n=1 Tax=Sinomicrobium weinanense TaxID=2842200 RepID=A0A926JRM0_9FLAO|nr:DUF4258 domain-containing protein [Sinomicrobium weinanense]MBC9796220.1 DUF4258 domain-containing protein [Sinomicrobium weinanense]MBU3122325.1 DUF4258 domain-containing protein [Sinomicrobium weinanense]
MDILRRIGLYLVGLAIGIVIVTFIFREKGTEFCYSPNCRVLKNIREKAIVYSEDARKSLKENAIDTTGISVSVFTKGDVIFSKSNTELDSCKTYTIEGTLTTGKIEVFVKNCDRIAKIATITPLD